MLPKGYTQDLVVTIHTGLPCFDGEHTSMAADMLRRTADYFDKHGVQLTAYPFHFWSDPSKTVSLADIDLVEGSHCIRNIADFQPGDTITGTGETVKFVNDFGAGLDNGEAIIQKDLDRAHGIWVAREAKEYQEDSI